MSKKTIIIILGIVVLVLLIIFIYPRIGIMIKEYKLNKLTSQVFPEQPQIKNIANPKITGEIIPSDVNWPFLEGQDIFFLDKNYALFDLNLDNLQSSRLPFINISNDTKIENVKWFNKSKIILFQLKASSQISASEEEITPDSSDVETIISMVDLQQNRTYNLPADAIDALWNSKNGELIMLEKDQNNNYILSEIDQNLNKKNIFNFGNTEIFLLNNQAKTINNLIFFTKSTGNNTLYKLDLNSNQESEILDNVVTANVSPNGEFALINLIGDSSYTSIIYNLKTNNTLYKFTLPILTERTCFDPTGQNLYYTEGENLKVGDESKYLDRKPSYVFFVYHSNLNSVEQLNNHLINNPLDPIFLMINNFKNKLYFVNLPQQSLFYMEL